MATSSRSPISRVGGKFNLANKIIALFPPHSRYIEPFGGAAHILFKKEPSITEVYNDLDGSLVNFFRHVKTQPDALIERLGFSLYSREEFEEALAILKASSRYNAADGQANEYTDLDKAVAFYTVNRQCFAGKMSTWAITEGGVSTYYSFEKRIRLAHDRLKNVYIEHRDYKDIIARHDRPDSLFYLDPPYIFNDQRGKGKLYRNEMTDQDHVELVDILKGIKGKFILSGYANSIYDCFERISIGESSISIKGIFDGGKRPKKEEFVWVNF